MRIQQTNLPKMQELNPETTQEPSTGNAVAKHNQKDVFEAAISAQQEASMLKRKQAQVEAATKNLEGLTPPIVGSSVDSFLSMGKGDTTETGKDASQYDSLASQKAMQKMAEAVTAKSDESTRRHTLLKKIIDDAR